MHQVQHTPSTAYTEYSIQAVQHAQDCLSSPHSHDYELTPESSVSFRRASLHDRLPSASSPWDRKGDVTFSHSHCCELTNWWIESQHRAHIPSTTSKYSSNLARSQPPSASAHSLDHGLQLDLSIRLLPASRCISKLARSRPRSISKYAWLPPSYASPHSLDHGLQVYLWIRSITACKPISKLAQLWTPSASSNSLDYGIQVYLEIRLITASKYILKLARSQPQSVSLSSLDRHFEAHLQLLSSSACSQSRYTVCRWVPILKHRWEYKLTTWVLKIIEQWVVAMISRRTCNVPKDVCFPRLLYSDSRCFQACRWCSQVISNLS